MTLLDQKCSELADQYPTIGVLEKDGETFITCYTRVRLSTGEETDGLIPRKRYVLLDNGILRPV